MLCHSEVSDLASLAILTEMTRRVISSRKAWNLSK